MSSENFNSDKIKFAPPIFPSIMAPNGFLDQFRESHALWYYYLCARQAYEASVLDPMEYEGEKDSQVNYHELFRNIAKIYGVQPENMANCWHQIDAQCGVSLLPKLPDEDRYRFNKKIILS